MQLVTAATAADEKERNAKVALLPVGNFEQHGDFLPLVTDTVVATAIAREIATVHAVMLLPPVTISCSHEHSTWRGTVSISSQTLSAIVTDVAESLARSGVEHLVLVNGHGGNYVLSNVVQEYTAANGPTMSLYPQGHDWTKARTDAGMETNSHDDMHAGELETSLLLHVAPELIRAGNETADWTAGHRPHLLTLGMSAYTASGVIGRPSLGTADKGKVALASLTRSFNEHRQALGI
ncbi:creatininase family protein [Micromonospora sp. LH3U1]|uniref:creatininase family protein n=1 Tax=Micromonospora sp. LH3U1 TaxID=3018339 RepID=UPI0023497107|nr:creatininase family protein [Micromonospora sp. LH3U1]WCN83809.1 creatininase family protein [Micromonospora sp. LH3U1]